MLSLFGYRQAQFTTLRKQFLCNCEIYLLRFNIKIVWKNITHKRETWKPSEKYKNKYLCDKDGKHDHHIFDLVEVSLLVAVISYD